MPAPQVVASAMTMCTFGIGPGELLILPESRILSSGLPAGNIMDFVPFMNVLPFPLCQSPANPAVMAIIIATLGSTTKGPCIPATVAPWIPGDPTVFNGIMPALVMGNECICAFGGMISVVEPGQFTEIS